MYFGDAKMAPIIGAVQDNSAAYEAGFKVGDVVISVDGDQITSFEDISHHTVVSSDRPLKFVVDRDGIILDLIAIPRMTKRKDQFGNDYQTGLVGIGPDANPLNVIRSPLGPVDAFVKSIDSIGLIISRTYHFLRELIEGKQDASQLRGPLGIGQMTSQVATLGIFSLMSLAAALSVSIGLMNLFPIPMLDGGHLMFYGIEALRGKALNPRAQDVAFRIGLTCVLVMMLFVTSNDIMRFAWDLKVNKLTQCLHITHPMLPLCRLLKNLYGEPGDDGCTGKKSLYKQLTHGEF